MLTFFLVGMNNLLLESAGTSTCGIDFLFRTSSTSGMMSGSFLRMLISFGSFRAELHFFFLMRMSFFLHFPKRGFSSHFKCGACYRRSVLLRFGSGSFGWGSYIVSPVMFNAVDLDSPATFHHCQKEGLVRVLARVSAIRWNISCRFDIS